MVLGYLLRHGATTVGRIWMPDSFAYLALARGFLTFENLSPDAWPGLHYPPLFPWVLNLAVRLGEDPLVSAALTNAFLGVLATVPIYFFTRRLFGRTAALAASSLHLFSRLAVSYEFQALSEGFFIFLLYTALLTNLEARRRGRAAWFFLLGLLTGLLYLTRLAGVAVLGGCLLLELATGFRRIRGEKESKPVIKQRAMRASLILLGFLFAAGPYLLHVRSQVGRFTLTTASNLAGKVRDRRVRGDTLSFERERLALNADATDWAYKEGAGGRGMLSALLDDPAEFARYTALNVKTVLGEHVAEALSPFPLALLALFGLIGGFFDPGRRRATGAALFWFAVTLSPFILTIVDERYCVPSLPLAFALAGAGIDRLARLAAAIYGKRMEKRRGEGRGEKSGEETSSRPYRVAAAILLAASLLLVSGWMISPGWTFVPRFAKRAPPPEKTLGELIGRNLPRGTRIAARWPISVYYAGGEFQPLPYDTLPRTLKFLRLRGTRVLLLSDLFIKKYRPQWSGLLRKGYGPTVGLEPAAVVPRYVMSGGRKVLAERYLVFRILPER